MVSIIPLMRHQLERGYAQPEPRSADQQIAIQTFRELYAETALLIADILNNSVYRPHQNNIKITQAADEIAFLLCRYDKFQALAEKQTRSQPSTNVETPRYGPKPGQDVEDSLLEARKALEEHRRQLRGDD
jgi:hypothetical protein